MIETSDNEPDSEPPRPPFRPLRRWRARHAAGAGLSLALLALIFGLGALVVVLSLGRVNLDAFKPMLTSALQQKLGPAYRVEIGEMAVERQDHGLALALSNFVVRQADGPRLVTAPKADLIFDPLSLLAGRINPSRVELEDLTVELRVLPDGGLDLRAGGSEPPGLQTCGLQPEGSPPAPELCPP